MYIYIYRSVCFFVLFFLPLCYLFNRATCRTPNYRKEKSTSVDRHCVLSQQQPKLSVYILSGIASFLVSMNL